MPFGEVTDRDVKAILAPLCLGQMSYGNLFEHSQWIAFDDSDDNPFSEPATIRHRARVLKKRGLIITRQYAKDTLNGQTCCALTTKGYGELQKRVSDQPALLGPLPALQPVFDTKLAGEVRYDNQRHHDWMMQFYAKTFPACYERGFQVTFYQRENTHPVKILNRPRDHDGHFGLQILPELNYGYFVEVDTGSETVGIEDAKWAVVEEWLKTYLYYDASVRTREKVLIVSTRGGKRLQNIMTLARKLVGDRDRNLFLGVDLPVYLRSHDPLLDRCCVNQQGQRCSLLDVPPTRDCLLASMKNKVRTADKLVYLGRGYQPVWTTHQRVHRDLTYLQAMGWVKPCTIDDYPDKQFYQPTPLGYRRLYGQDVEKLALIG